MANIPFVKNESKYDFSFKGPLPYLMNFENIHGVKTYLRWLRTEKRDLDYRMTKKEIILRDTLTSLVCQSLKSARLWMFWCDHVNFKNVSHVFCKNISYILKS